MRSKYIVIEGLEGAGKTTARNVVVETLEQLATWFSLGNLAVRNLPKS